MFMTLAIIDLVFFMHPPQSIQTYSNTIKTNKYIVGYFRGAAGGVLWV